MIVPDFLAATAKERDGHPVFMSRNGIHTLNPIETKFC